MNHSEQSIRLYANCKINIGLRIKSRRSDGYHEIETIFYPVKKLYDIIDVSRMEDNKTNTKDIVFTSSGLSIDCKVDDNLIVKAYRQMASHYPQIGSVRVHLTKQVPFGAGLGGGSSDATNVVLALNRLFALNLNNEQLIDEVMRLGADCSFFVYNTACKASGIGEKIDPIDMDWSGKRVVMLKPPVNVSTKEAYQGATLHSEPFDWRVNDFEQSVFALYPVLGEVKNALLYAGAEYAAMSGSGSTIYGVFEDNAESSALSDNGLLDKEFASMVIFNDTL